MADASTPAPGASPAPAPTTEAAFARFDQLEPVAPEEMLGSGSGEGFPTGHPLDGLLEAWHWRGKRYDSLEEVHTLVFEGWGGGQVQVNQALLPIVLLRARCVGRLAPFGGLFPLAGSPGFHQRLRRPPARHAVSRAH